ncbi:MAG: Gfo/Idh/MocA family oxidoreductase [Armatimonadota bacterium]|nr:Gfo/Idh/MocA family oxidoreductase [Armatimonadota bacterium]
MSLDDGGLSRREFIKGSAAVAVTLGLASGVSAQQPDARKIRCGVIGVGVEGSRLLSKLVRIPGVRVPAICDIYEPNLKDGLKIAGLARGYEDYRWMLDRDDLDAIFIATPLNLHGSMAIDAMKSGKHVFCEKMMAYSIDEAKEMLRTSTETGKRLQIGYQQRYNAIYNHAYELIKQGVLGKITHVRCMWNRNGSWRRAVPDQKYERLFNWRMYKEYSQGLMAELGSHQTHVVNWFLESVPVSVMGSGGIDYWKDGRETYDNVNVIFEYPEGVRLYFQSLTTNQYDDHYEQFMGDKGTLIITPVGARLFREPQAEQLTWGDAAHKEKAGGKEAIVLDADVTAKLKAQTGAGEQIAAGEKNKDDYMCEIESFIACVLENKQPDCDGQEGLESAVTCLLANQAMAQGKKLFYKPEMFKV